MPAGRPHPATPVLLAARLRQRHAGRRVLVAEDDPVSQSLMVELLTEVGLLADVADDGLQAVNMALRSTYAMVLLDLRMPRLGGLDVARALRAMLATVHTPIVAVTANASEEDRAACRAVGMNGFLPKPVVVERLFELLLQALDRSEGPALDQSFDQRFDQPVSLSTSPSRAAPEPDARLQPLLELDGLDALRGLAAVGGRIEVYRSLLALFIAHHGADSQALNELTQRGDVQGVAQQAHSLRGSAATLGLVDVETTAEALEDAVDQYQSRGVVAALCVAVADALARTIGTLQKALGEPASPADSNPTG